MGAEYTPAQRAASKRYEQARKNIRLLVKVEEWQAYKDQAEREGKDLKPFIIDCINEHMNRVTQNGQNQ